MGASVIHTAVHHLGAASFGHGPELLYTAVHHLGAASFGHGPELVLGAVKHLEADPAARAVVLDPKLVPALARALVQPEAHLRLEALPPTLHAHANGHARCGRARAHTRKKKNRFR